MKNQKCNIFMMCSFVIDDENNSMYKWNKKERRVINHKAVIQNKTIILDNKYEQTNKQTKRERKKQN